ncbi:MAG: DUF2461 domain-containing protein [Candidatus Delongbacteria bacterium]|nr:DUF2461 domain-containing protein [Candidatus Delongbacteria bacterium]
MFNGFVKETFIFLKMLELNNNKEWFHDHKEDYKQFVEKPFYELMDDLKQFMLKIDENFDMNPKKIISRIYRDVRFSVDKSPYRSNVWLAYKRIYPDWKVEPTYFIELTPENFTMGMGFYKIPKSFMDIIRRKIDDKDRMFLKIHELYCKQNIFTIAGDKYKRALNNDHSEELNQWYQRKELYFISTKENDETLLSRDISEYIKDSLLVLKPIYDFFISLKE